MFKNIFGKRITAVALLGASTIVVAGLASAVGNGWIPAAEARQRFDKTTAEPADENIKQGLLLIREKNYESAIDSFKQAVYFSRNHYNPKAYRLLGLCYKATRSYAKAIEALTMELQQTQEKEPDVHIDLAECYLDTGQNEKARDEINKAYTDQTEGSGTWRQKYAMGELHERMNDPGQALSFFESAVDEKPYYSDATMGVGRMDLVLKRYQPALATYRKILDHGPMYQGVDLYTLYYSMGQCFAAFGDHQGALDHWHMSLEQNPESFDAHLAIANMLDSEKHYGSAIKEFEAALRDAPKTADQTMLAKISQRLQYIQNQLLPREAAPVIKPSPQMRQEYEDEVKRRDENSTTVPQSRDSGF